MILCCMRFVVRQKSSPWSVVSDHKTAIKTCSTNLEWKQTSRAYARAQAKEHEERMCMTYVCMINILRTRYAYLHQVRVVCDTS